MMRQYIPRRANATRWLQGAPAYVLDVLDNGGKTTDRYTVLFCGALLGLTEPGKPRTRGNVYIPYLGMSDAPTHPQGFSMWGELSACDAAAYRYRAGHERIKWADLPAHIRAHVIARATQE